MLCSWNTVVASPTIVSTSDFYVTTIHTTVERRTSCFRHTQQQSLGQEEVRILWSRKFGRLARYCSNNLLFILWYLSDMQLLREYFFVWATCVSRILKRNHLFRAVDEQLCCWIWRSRFKKKQTHFCLCQYKCTVHRRLVFNQYVGFLRFWPRCRPRRRRRRSAQNPAKVGRRDRWRSTGSFSCKLAAIILNVFWNRKPVWFIWQYDIVWNIRAIDVIRRLMSCFWLYHNKFLSFVQPEEITVVFFAFFVA